MKYVFKYFDFVEDCEYVELVVIKELKLDYVEKFVICDLVNDIKECGCVEFVQSGGFDELVQIYEVGGDGIELFNCGIELRKVVIVVLFCVMCELDF